MHRFERTSGFLRAAPTALLFGACAFAVACETQPTDGSGSSSSKEAVVSAVSGVHEAAIARAKGAADLQRYIEHFGGEGWMVADISTAKVEQREGEIPVSAIKSLKGEEVGTSAPAEKEATAKAQWTEVLIPMEKKGPDGKGSRAEIIVAFLRSGGQPRVVVNPADEASAALLVPNNDGNQEQEISVPPDEGGDVSPLSPCGGHGKSCASNGLCCSGAHHCQHDKICRCKPGTFYSSCRFVSKALIQPACRSALNPVGYAHYRRTITGCTRRTGGALYASWKGCGVSCPEVKATDGSILFCGRVPNPGSCTGL